jgi:hypothetical protein
VTTLAVAIAATCVFMVAQDVLGEGLTISSARGLAFFPGLFDGLGDFATRYGAAIIAVTSVHFGLWSWQTLAVVTSCAITSFFTSNFAAGKESKILPKDRLEKVSLAEMWRRIKEA